MALTMFWALLSLVAGSAARDESTFLLQPGHRLGALAKRHTAASVEHSKPDKLVDEVLRRYKPGKLADEVLQSSKLDKDKLADAMVQISKLDKPADEAPVKALGNVLESAVKADHAADVLLLDSAVKSVHEAVRSSIPDKPADQAAVKAVDNVLLDSATEAVDKAAGEAQMAVLARLGAMTVLDRMTALESLGVSEQASSAVAGLSLQQSSAKDASRKDKESLQPHATKVDLKQSTSRPAAKDMYKELMWVVVCVVGVTFLSVGMLVLTIHLTSDTAEGPPDVPPKAEAAGRPDVLAA